MDRLYSKEQIEEWASKRADDCGRVCKQLLDTMRENERLREGLQIIAGSKIGSSAVIAEQFLRPTKALTS